MCLWLNTFLRWINTAYFSLSIRYNTSKAPESNNNNPKLRRFPLCSAQLCRRSLSDFLSTGWRWPRDAEQQRCTPQDLHPAAAPLAAPAALAPLRQRCRVHWAAGSVCQEKAVPPRNLQLPKPPCFARDRKSKLWSICMH